MNGLDNLQETYREYSLAHTDYLIRTSLDPGGQRSKVKVTAGRLGGDGIYYDAGASKSTQAYS